ncbi:unnamed protein product [Allacma fusca]|uniref:Uncharacterized protein n=2 Tax=Allacma fusca TaxID=39272 RepID=A0A8J2L415_9HEXA|nr:unnamed protein product [Allacma fusca]
MIALAAAALRKRHHRKYTMAWTPSKERFPGECTFELRRKLTLIRVPDPGFDFSNPNIKPACLPYKLGGVGMIHEGLASGWGRMNKYAQRHGTPPYVKRLWRQHRSER